ncbi:hypothetical protein PCANC_28300 [Puccinia coronata f. sp. avenae]|uniref:Uncharacterized protein n=1 Tax=Puccinia coronata f. sp. avenae TaxID=200324 RepID=A0A2N5RX79_9BASI|nr:hypothetical protein PCANC_28300 [Puccinia coronata f. sp. avenae]
MKDVARILLSMTLLSVLTVSPVFSSLLGKTVRQSFNLRGLDVAFEDQDCPVPLRACAVLPTNRSLDLHVALSKRTIAERNWDCANLQNDVNSCGSCDNDSSGPVTVKQSVPKPANSFQFT